MSIHFEEMKFTQETEEGKLTYESMIEKVNVHKQTYLEYKSQTTSDGRCGATYALGRAVTSLATTSWLFLTLICSEMMGISRSGSVTSSLNLPLLFLVEGSGFAGMDLTLPTGLLSNLVFLACLLSWLLSGTASETKDWDVFNRFNCLPVLLLECGPFRTILRASLQLTSCRWFWRDWVFCSRRWCC